MYLSLCLPTNGISEWVFPALDSIYLQEVDINQFEVIVTDNGSNDDFSMKMEIYSNNHQNIIYKKTDAYMFDNQLEALKIARGDYLKFVNHRSIWKPGRLQYMIDFLKQNEEEKPVIYFSNGVLGWGPMFKEFSGFDEFVRNLGIYGTWTSGVGIWREDFDRIPKDYKYDKISPHAGILYAERNRSKYIINEFKWMSEIDLDHSKKGKYDLYKAFALDEFIITLNLYRDGDISIETLISVKEDFRKFLQDLYYDFNLLKKPCSYDLNGFDKYLGVFFDKEDIIRGARQKYRKMKE
ncbi:MAG: glycosyltransferase family A protein [Lachnospiraceae bacterium]|nr:glycosyltransferase family A protein [Lachnospiraceae bacterium]